VSRCLFSFIFQARSRTQKTNTCCALAEIKSKNKTLGLGVVLTRYCMCEHIKEKKTIWISKKGQYRGETKKHFLRGARTRVKKRVSVAADHEVDSIHFLSDLFVHRVPRVADGDQNINST
jgi:hypothetical protein